VEHVLCQEWTHKHLHGSFQLPLICALHPAGLAQQRCSASTALPKLICSCCPIQAGPDRCTQTSTLLL
jgi:hypothetical protein